jgi:hypothetical protein
MPNSSSYTQIIRNRSPVIAVEVGKGGSFIVEGRLIEGQMSEGSLYSVLLRWQTEGESRHDVMYCLILIN